MTQPTLYIVATPLGNLQDMSPRAVRCLTESSVIFAEDTRHSRILLDHFGIKKPLVSLHEHNERARVETVLRHLEAGESIALVSDAGTPGVSDPGADLARAVADHGFRVSPIPGPSALAAALSVAGFFQSSTNVLFLGFLEPRGSERRSVLERIVGHSGLVVLYESPHRLHDTLHDLSKQQPTRQVCFCRELTKIYEEIKRGTLDSVFRSLPQEIKGEITLVLGPTDIMNLTPDDKQMDAALRRCITDGMSVREASTAVATVLELSRKKVYSRCLEMKKENS